MCQINSTQRIVKYSAMLYIYVCVYIFLLLYRMPQIQKYSIFIIFLQSLLLEFINMMWRSFLAPSVLFVKVKPEMGMFILCVCKLEISDWNSKFFKKINGERQVTPVDIQNSSGDT